MICQPKLSKTIATKKFFQANFNNPIEKHFARATKIWRCEGSLF